MSLSLVLSVIFVLVLAGLVVKFADKLNIDETFKSIIKGVAVVAAIFWTLNALLGPGWLVL